MEQAYFFLFWNNSRCLVVCGFEVVLVHGGVNVALVAEVGQGIVHVLFGQPTSFQPRQYLVPESQ